MPRDIYDPHHRVLISTILMASNAYGFSFSMSDGTDIEVYEKMGSTPVAKISGGEHDGAVIYLNPPRGDDDERKDEDSEESEDLEEFECKYCHEVFESERSLNRHIKGKCKAAVIGKKKSIMFRNGFEFSDGNRGKFIPLPNIIDRENMYVAGPQKSGKSYFAAEYCRNFLKIFPEKDCVLFTKIPHDVSIDAVADEFPGRVKKFLIEGEEGKALLDNPVNVKKELQNALVIFDDIEASSNPKVTKYMHLLRDDVMKNGRDQSEQGLDTYTLVTNHQITDYQKTRDVIFESSCIVIFPFGGNHEQIERVLRTKVGMSKINIDKILRKTQSRWVAVYKRCPMYVCHERGIYLL